MVYRIAVACLIAGIVACGCKSFDPWQDTLENPEVQALKSEYGEPMKYKAVVGLRIDPAALGRSPSDEVAALKAETAELALAVQAARDAIARGVQGVSSPDDVAAILESLSTAAAAIKAEFGPEKRARVEAVTQAIKSATTASNAISAISTKLAAEGADLVVLVQPLADAASEFNTASMFASALAEALQAASDPEADSLKAAVAATEGVLAKILEAAADVESGNAADGSAKIAEVLPLVTGLKTKLDSLAGAVFDAPAAIAALIEAASAASGAAAPIRKSIADAVDLSKAHFEAALAAGADIDAMLEALDQGVEQIAAAAAETAQAKEAGETPFAPFAAVLSDPRTNAYRIAMALESKISAGGFGDEQSVIFLNSLKESLARAATALGEAAAKLAAGDADAAVALCGDAAAAAGSLAPALDAEAKRVAPMSSKIASFQPSRKDFIDVFVDNLERFGMFHSVQALSGLPEDAEIAEFREAAEFADADFLVLVEPTRNDVVYMGHNSNWWASFFVWSFAWLASNFIPDETWESRIGFKFTVIDARSGAALYCRNVDSKAALHLSDIEDGFHLFGLLTSAVSRSNLEDAYEKVMPYHLNVLRRELLKEIAVGFRDCTATEEFSTARAAAPPAGFGIVAGVGNYRAKVFAGGVHEGLDAAKDYRQRLTSASETLSRVADALEAELASQGSSALDEGLAALRRAVNLAQVCSREFSDNDLPVAVRSLSAALDEIKAARATLASAEPKPGILDEMLAEIDAIAADCTSASMSAAAIKPAEKAVAIASLVTELLPEAEKLPGLLTEAAEKLGDKGAQAAELSAEVKAAVDSVSSARTALSINSMPAAASALKSALEVLSRAASTIDAIKGEAIEMASVSGKIEFIRNGVENALAETASFNAPEELVSLAAAVDAISTRTDAAIKALEADENKAAARAADRGKVVEAARPAAASAAEAASALQGAIELLTSMKGAQAADLLRAASASAAGIAESLEPVVKNLPTLVGEIIKSAEIIGAIAAQQAEISKSGAAAPGKEALGDLPAMQAELAAELEKNAVELGDQAAVLLEAGDESNAAEVRTASEALAAASMVAADAARCFELVDAPGGLKKQDETLAAVKTAGETLKKLAAVVNAVGKHAFAMDGLAARQEGLMKQASSIVQALKNSMDSVAAAQEALLDRMKEARAALTNVLVEFPKARVEEPAVVSAVDSACDEIAKVWERGQAAVEMFRNADALGGARELENMTAWIGAVPQALLASVEGKRTHVDWIKEVTADMKAVSDAAAKTAGALIEGASRFELDRAADDALSFGSYITDPEGAAYSPNRVAVLTDGKATADGIRGSFDELLGNRVQENDLFVFFFSGCGGLMKVPFVHESEIRAMIPRLSAAAEKVVGSRAAVAGLQVPEDLTALEAEMGAIEEAVSALGAGASALASAIESGRDAGFESMCSSTAEKLGTAETALRAAAAAAAAGDYTKAIASAREGRTAAEAASAGASFGTDSPATAAIAAAAEAAAGALKSIETSPPVVAADKLTMVLDQIATAADEGAKALVKAASALQEDESTAEAAAQALSAAQAAADAANALQEARKAMVASDFARGREQAALASSALDGVAEALRAIAADNESLSVARLKIDEANARLAEGLAGIEAAAADPASDQAAVDAQGAADAAASACAAIDQASASALQADQDRKTAAPAMAALAAKFAEPVAAIARAREMAKAWNMPSAAESLTAASAGLMAVIEEAAAIAPAPGVEEYRAGIAAKAAAIEVLAGRAAALPVSEELAKAASDADSVLTSLQEEASALESLCAECAAAVPEPLSALKAAHARVSQAAAGLQKAREAMAVNDMAAAGPALEKAAENAIAAAQAIDEMAGKMNDMFARYILPEDFDPERPAETAISLYEIGQLAAGLKAKNAVFVFDASFAPGQPRRGFGVLAGDEPAAVTDDFTRYVSLRPGWSVILASGASEGAGQSKESGGLLSSAIVACMRGAGDVDGDGKVSFAELDSFVRKAISDSGAAQSPVIRGESPDAPVFEPAEKDVEDED